MPNEFDVVAQTWDQEQYRHDRAQAVVDQIRRQVVLTPQMRVLEFGCGTGLLGFQLVADVALLTFADTSAGMLAQVQEKIRAAGIANAETVLMAPEPLRFPQSYDCIVSLMTLHHIERYDAAIRSLAEHLRPNGVLCIADLDQEDGSFHGNKETVHHGIDREHLKQIFRENGLSRIAESTPYIMRKQVGTHWREFPIFLLTGQSGE
jgi:cyclopropane fatty-acyl-phospholipid synthase-like methyltransferase